MERILNEDPLRPAVLISFYLLKEDSMILHQHISISSLLRFRDKIHGQMAAAAPAG